MVIISMIMIGMVMISMLIMLIGMVMISMLIMMIGMAMIVLNSDVTGSITYDTRPRGYKTFFMLNSVEHEIFPAHKC